MRPSVRFATAVLIIASIVADVVLADSAPPQKQLKAYALPGSTQSADISPDEQSVVTVCAKQLNVAGSEKQTVVQLWNFKEAKQLAEFTEQQSEPTVAPKGYLLDRARNMPIIRFSPDGNLVVAMIGRTIHVLRATNLTELQAIPLDVPDNVTRTSSTGRIVTHEPSVRAMELSPDGGVMAVLWVTNMIHGRIQL